MCFVIRSPFSCQGSVDCLKHSAYTSLPSGREWRAASELRGLLSRCVRAAISSCLKQVLFVTIYFINPSGEEELKLSFDRITKNISQ